MCDSVIEKLCSEAFLVVVFWQGSTIDSTLYWYSIAQVCLMVCPLLYYRTVNIVT